MPLQLLIRLGLNYLDPVEAVIVSDDQPELQVKTEDNLDKLRDIPYFYHTIALLPASLVRLTEATLPQAARQQLLRAVPFALEDSLTQAPESLHFALGARMETLTPVAIIDKQSFATIYDHLQAINLGHAKIISEIQALPYRTETWTLLAEKDSVLIRSGPYRGFRCLYMEALSFLQLAIAQSIQKPLQLDCYLTADSSFNLAQLQQAFPDLDCKEHAIKQAADIFIPTLKRTTYPLLDLRQGDYQTSHKLNTSWAWRLAMVGLFLNLVLLGASSSAEYYLLKQKNQALSAHIKSIYTQVFPQANNVVSPKIRFEQRLKSLTVQAQGSTWHQLVGTSIPILEKYAAIEITHIQFKDPTLELSVSVDDFESLANCIKELEHAGLKISQQKSVNPDKSITAKLLIQGSHS